MIKDKLFILLTDAEVPSKYFDEGNRSHSNYYFTHSGKNDFSMFQSLKLANFFSNANRVMNWVCLLFIIVGFSIVLSSLLGNNGKWRKKGWGMIISGYAWIIVSHVAIIAAPAFGNFGDFKIFIFAMTLVCQLFFFVAPPTLFTLASQNMEMFEMSQQPQLQRDAQQKYSFIPITIIVGVVANIIGGLI